jgi:hypothetical protein
MVCGIRSDVQQHYFEAIKWAMGLTNAAVARGLKGPATTPATTPATSSHPGWAMILRVETFPDPDISRTKG